MPGLTNTTSSYCKCSYNCPGLIPPSTYCTCIDRVIKKNNCNYPHRQGHPWTDFEMLRIGYQVRSHDKSIAHMAWEFQRTLEEVAEKFEWIL